MVDPLPAFDASRINDGELSENGPGPEAGPTPQAVAPVYNESPVLNVSMLNMSVFDVSVRPNDDGPESEVVVEVEVAGVVEVEVVAEAAVDVVAESEVAARKTIVS